MDLLPSEEYRLRKETEHSKRQGILGITNFRVIWSPHDLESHSLTYSYSKIFSTDFIHQDAKRRSILKVTLKVFIHSTNEYKNIYFTFNSNRHREDVEMCADHIRSYLLQQQPIDESLFLDQITQKKIRVLSANPMLNTIHRTFVRNGDLPDSEFWKQVQSYQDFLLTNTINNQTFAKVNFIVRVPHRYDSLNDNIINLDMDVLRNYKDLIFRQFPEIHSDYSLTVPHKKKEEDYWKHLWENKISRGIIMSDALEFLPNQLNRTTHKATELTKSVGNYRALYPLHSPAYQLMDKMNSHSSHVIKEAKMPLNTEPLQFPEFVRIERDSEKMRLDVAEPEDSEWVLKLEGQLKDEDIVGAFLGKRESYETIRENLKSMKSDTIGASQVNTEYIKRIYDLLQFFYYFYSKQNQTEMGRLLDLIKNILNEMRRETSDNGRIHRLEQMRQNALEKYTQLNYLNNTN